MKKYVFLIVLLVLMFKFNDIKSHAYANNYDSFGSAQELKLGESKIACFNKNYDYDYFHFKTTSYGGSMAYNIYSTYFDHYRVDLKAWLYQKSGFWIWSKYNYKGNDDDSGIGRNFRFEYHLDGGKNFYFKARPYFRNSSGCANIIVEKNQDKAFSITGGTWIPDDYYKDFTSPINYYTKEQAEKVYEIIANRDSKLLVEFIDNFVLENGIIDSFNISSFNNFLYNLTDTQLNGIQSSVYQMLDSIPSSTDNTISPINGPYNLAMACNGEQYIDENGKNKVNCNNGVRERLGVFETYNSTTIVGLPGLRGKFSKNVIQVW